MAIVAIFERMLETYELARKPPIESPLLSLDARRQPV